MELFSVPKRERLHDQRFITCKLILSQDHLNTLKSKISKQEKSFQQEYFSLTDDYKRITDQFKELQKKFRHFQIADSKKYRQIWQMNEEIAKEKLRKVLQADRIIHEQQLGLEWTPPDEDLFKSAEHTIEKVERRDKEPVAAALMIASTFAESGDEDEGGVKDSFGVRLTRKGYSKTMKLMLELLCNEAGFLVEERLQKLLNPLHRDEQSLMKLDSILKALGVETVEDIESLTSYFVSKHPKGEEHAVPGEVKVNSTDGSAVLINPNEVVKAIRKFVEEQRNKSGDSDPNLQSRPDSSAQDESPEEEDVRASQASLEPPPANNYWEKFNTCLNDQNYRTWSAVYVGMEKYNQLLSERWQLTQEITSVTRQNAELRQLLKQYMTARVNDDLHVPPTRILLAQAGLLQK
jgi:dynein regulatory complex protein 1